MGYTHWKKRGIKKYKEDLSVCGFEQLNTCWDLTLSLTLGQYVPRNL